MTVIGELNHIFEVYQRGDEIVMPLKDGGRRKIHLQIRETPYNNLLYEVTVTLLDCGEGEIVSGELYDSERLGKGRKIKEAKAGICQIRWRIAKKDRAYYRLHLTIRPDNAINTNETPNSIEEAEKELEKKNGLALAENYSSLRKKGLMSDVTIACEGKKFPAHKLILAARSEVFAAMFSHKGTLEDQHQEVLIEDSDRVTMDLFLTFLYDATLPKDLPFKSYVELLKAADKYQVPSLIEACATKLSKKLSTENEVVQGAILGSIYRIPMLKNEAIKAITKPGATTLNSMDEYHELRNYPDLLVEILIEMKRSR